MKVTFTAWYCIYIQASDLKLLVIGCLKNDLVVSVLLKTIPVFDGKRCSTSRLPSHTAGRTVGNKVVILNRDEYDEKLNGVLSDESVYCKLNQKSIKNLAS